MPNRNNSLSVVVPLSILNRNLSTLQLWLAKTKNISILKQVIIVVDKLKDESFDTIPLKNKLRLNSKIQILEGNYNSPGKARNIGLKLVSSRFVTFWDSDDYPILSSLDVLEDQFLIDYDIQIFKFRTNNKVSKTIKYFGNDNISILRNLGLWRMVFRVEFLDGITFCESRMGEDQVFYAECLAKNPRISKIEVVMYEYIIHEGYQLTKDKYAISEIKDSRQNLFEIIRKSPKLHPILIMMLIRLTFTELKAHVTFKIKRKFNG